MSENIYAEYETFVKAIPPRGIKCVDLGLGFPNCKGHLDTDDIATYPHDGGINVPGLEGKHWVYLHCSACDFDASWWKVTRRLMIREAKGI